MGASSIPPVHPPTPETEQQAIKVLLDIGWESYYYPERGETWLRERRNHD